MNAPSIVSRSDIPAAKRIGRHRIAGGGAARGGQQRDLGRRVEAEAEEQPEGVHVPRLAHGARGLAVDPRHGAAALELALERPLVEGAVAHAQEDAQHRHQDDQVQDPDQQQERAGDRGPDDPGRLVQRRVAAGDRPAEAAHAEREAGGEQEHHRGVPEGEEEPDAQRPLPLAHELARRVVDRPDVVGVEGVAHAERVGGDAHAHAEDPRADAQVLRGDEPEQQREARDVQAQDDRREHRGAPPLRGAERARDAPEPSPSCAHPGDPRHPGGHRTRGRSQLQTVAGRTAAGRLGPPSILDGEVHRGKELHVDRR
jgi:hypothetical protein